MATFAELPHLVVALLTTTRSVDLVWPVVVNQVHLDSSLMLLTRLDLSLLHLRGFALAFPKQVQLWPTEWMRLCLLSSTQVGLGLLLTWRIVRHLVDHYMMCIVLL